MIVLGFTLCEASDLWLLVLWFNTLPSNVSHLLSSRGICNPRFSAPNIVKTNQEKEKKKDLELCQTFFFVLKPCGTFKNRLALIKFMVKIWSEIQNEELGPCVSIVLEGITVNTLSNLDTCFAYKIALSKICCLLWLCALIIQWYIINFSLQIDELSCQCWWLFNLVCNYANCY